MIRQYVRTPPTRAAAVVGSITLVMGLAACSEDPPDPQPAADSMALALASGDFAAAPLAGEPTPDVEAEVEEIVEGMDAATRSARVAEVVADEEEDDVWAVTFEIAWELDGGGGAGEGDDEATEEADSGDGGDDGGSGVVWSYTTSGRLGLISDEDDEWQIEWSPALLHPDLEAGDRLRLRREQAERAEILGANGSALVTERDVYRFGIDKTKFDDGVSEETMVSSARELAELVDVDAESLGDRVLAAGERAFVEAITFREDDAQPYLSDVSDIAGAAAFPGTMQLAPTRDFARPVLGTVGDATAEIVEESEGRIQAGDTVGLSGLQQQYDDRLRGTPGLTVEVVPAEGDPEAVFETDAVPGEALGTTIDVELQTRAESVLSDVEPASAIVAISPSTGDVVAAASGPGGEGYSTATLGQYAPGSTFKVVTALSLLRAGLTPDTTVDCPPTLTVDGREFGNYSDYPDSAVGEISLSTAVAESCNTAMMSARDEVSQQDLAEAGSSLGLGFEGDLGFPAFLGTVPEEADGTAHAAAMIGQGEVLASPLAMATVAASVVTGETVVPRLLEDVDGAGDDGASPALPAEEAEQVRDMMLAAVDGGSASSLADIPGDPVGAKTGTAEYGTDDPPRTHAWMIAFQGDLAVAAFVEDGESGSQTAGPLLEEFLTGS